MTSFSLPGLHRLRSSVPVLALAIFVAACAGEPEDGSAAPSANRTVAEASDPAPASAPAPRRGTAWVIFGADTVTAEVADTPEARERGLMHRTDLGENEGMLFVFSDTRIRSFWMRNTYIPLDIAFLDRDLVIVDIRQMEPEDETLVDSARPAMFALEVHQGWFARRGIEVGARAQVVWGR